MADNDSTTDDLPTPPGSDRFSCTVAGENLARGVSLCLVTAAQWFECAPLAGGHYCFTVAAESRRFLPVACVAPDDEEGAR